MSKKKQTPMMAQYLAIKESYEDAILFYRMGDFYEMFLEDAELASRVLEITLTSRNKNDSNPIPMCGVPFRAAKSYIARLISQGHKVAICDQVEDAAAAAAQRSAAEPLSPWSPAADVGVAAASSPSVRGSWSAEEVAGSSLP